MSAGVVERGRRLRPVPPGTLPNIGKLAVIIHDLNHQPCVERHVHSGIAKVTSIAELPGEFLAIGKAAVQVKKLHQIDD